MLLWSAGERSKPALSWENRYKAALGIAEALSYLHSGSPRPVIHRDVKSSNILLTEEFEPQVVTKHVMDPSRSEAFRLDLNPQLPRCGCGSYPISGWPSGRRRIRRP